jgi:hypothetical protein
MLFTDKPYRHMINIGFFKSFSIKTTSIECNKDITTLLVLF